MTIVFGIDPGYTGAIACMSIKPYELLSVIDTPLIKGAGKVKDEIDELAIKQYMETCLVWGLASVFIEKVHAMPGQGVTSMFRFGVSYGIVRAISAGLDLPVHLISPQAWRAAVGLPKSPDKASGKALARQRCAQLFPSFRPNFSRLKDSGRAEAVLIALAGKKLLA